VCVRALTLLRTRLASPEDPGVRVFLLKAAGDRLAALLTAPLSSRLPKLTADAV
jgi:hypothetical protein